MGNANVLVVAQTGGPTAVINSTLAGIIEEAQGHGEIGDIIGLQCGFEGLLNDQLVYLRGMTNDQLRRLRNTPGAFLGCSRMHLTGGIIKQIVERLCALKAKYFLQIGGNGTMFAAHMIEEAAREAGYCLQVIGVPKTVDNDIVGMDHTPGYGSAAKYVAQATLDIGIDLHAMRTFEQVRIVEVMGRNVGWLAAASGLARLSGHDLPHLIYLPEHPFNEQEFLDQVHAVVKRLGYALVVVGEGIKDEHGNCIGNRPFADIKTGSRVFGGAAAYLADRVSRVLKIRVRAQDLGMVQRSFACMRSEVDELEAYLIGRAAVKAALAGLSGRMVNIKGIFTPGDVQYYALPLIEVGGREKTVPAHYYDVANRRVTDEFIRWLKPLVGNWEPEYLHPDLPLSAERSV